MPDSAEYPGSPSLSVEARAKVQQTFRHTLELARAGRNEEALLGCDFILKMDSRFVPARKLLETLRGVASGTVIDLSAFDAAPAAPTAAPAAPAPAPAAAPVRPAEPPPTPPRGIPAAPRQPAPAPAAPPPGPAAGAPPAPVPGFGAPSPGSALSSLGFDDFASVDPFATPAAPPASPFAPAAPPPAAPGFAPDPFAAAPDVPPNPFAAPAPAPAPPADLGFGSPTLPDSFAAVPPPPDFGFGAAAPFAPPEPAAAPGFPPAEAPALPSGPAAPSGPAPADPRITQFLRQGDDAMAKGQMQEAIDLWSRVFLIDLSNEEASRRIDAAREKQSQTAQAIDALLTEGIQLFDSGDLDSARAKFLDVLALSETEGTARHYLNQIDASISARAAASAPAAAAAPAPAVPSYEEYSAPSAGPVDLGESEYGYEPRVPSEVPLAEEEEAVVTPAKKGGVDARVLIAVGLLVLAGIGFGAYQLLKPRPSAPPIAAPAPERPARPVGDDPIARAQALFDQGKVDEALQLLVSVPDADPRHADVMAMIDRIKSSAIPTPPAAAPSDAMLDEMRVTGLAAVAASRYIDAVKALDPVVKARPEDTEAAQGLAKAREELAALSAAIRAYNEQDYGSSIKLLWDLRKRDMKNQDVEEFLFKSYFNEGVQALQAGNFRGATESFQEASQLRPQDAEAKRHAAFAKKYSGGTTDLLSRIYVKNVLPRP